MINDKKYYVYMHINKINGKVYIGQTCQTPEKRWRKDGKGYLRKNKNGEYNNTYFANAIEKYGWDNFEHIVWAEGLTADEANRAERLLIAMWNTQDKKYGYNIKYGGDNHSQPKESNRKNSESHRGLQVGEKNGMYGVHRFGKDAPMYGKHHTEEAKEKNRASRKGKCIGKDNPKSSPTKCVETGIEYVSAQEASIKTGISADNIRRARRNLAFTAGGYHWIKA